MIFSIALLVTLSIFGDGAEYMAQADAAFTRIDYRGAELAYLGALGKSPDNPRILWRLARLNVLVSEVVEGEEHQSRLKTAEEYARKCIELDSTISDGHTWLAASLGYRALDAGLTEKVSLSFQLLEQIRYALILNPQDDIAYSIRGSFYRALGNVNWLQRGIANLLYGDIPGGGFAESEESLKNAVALAPEIMRHQYELGVLYLDMGRMDEARSVLRDAANLPIRIASDVPRREKIRELLATEFPGEDVDTLREVVR